MDMIVRLIPNISACPVLVRGVAFLTIVNLPAVLAMLWNWMKKQYHISFQQS